MTKHLSQNYLQLRFCAYHLHFNAKKKKEYLSRISTIIMVTSTIKQQRLLMQRMAAYKNMNCLFFLTPLQQNLAFHEKNTKSLHYKRNIERTPTSKFVESRNVSKSTFFDIFYKKSVAPFSIVFKLGTEKVINCGNWHSIGIQMSIYHNRVKIVSNIA